MDQVNQEGYIKKCGPYEEHRMPNGSTVFYRDDLHTYHSSIREEKGKWVGQGRWGDLPSPSQIGKFADPDPDRLLGWAAKKTIEGVSALMEKRAIPTDAEDLGALLRDEKLTWRDLRDSKGDTGTTTHWAFEHGLRGVHTDPEGSPEAARGYITAVNNALRDLDFRLLQSEVVVYSKEHGFAGRFDARIEVPVKDHSGGVLTHETWLLDLKTSNFVGRSMHAQLAGYDLAAEECGYGPSDRQFILQVREDGTYTLWPGRGSREHFLHCLELYKLGKVLDKQTKKDWKELIAA